MIRYLIIDDEFMAHEIIKGYCDLLPSMKFMKSCHDAVEALSYLHDHDVDLIFLDLNMPKLKGFEFLRTLSIPPKVIVTTAYSDFALEGFELNVIDYLLKPFSLERFLMAINKVKDLDSKTSEQVTPSDPSQKEIFLKSDKKHFKVVIDHILYAESAGNYTKVFTLDNTLTIREKLTTLLTALPEHDFIRVHKSFVISKKHIDSIEGNRVFIKDTPIPIGNVYKHHITELLKS